MSDFILLETGDALLQEIGDNLLRNFAAAISSSIDFNNGTITQAKLTVTGTGTIGMAMAADGVNFEDVTSGVLHTFTDTGTDLKWRATGTGITISEVKIEDYH